MKSADPRAILASASLASALAGLGVGQRLRQASSAPKREPSARSRLVVSAESALFVGELTQRSRLRMRQDEVRAPRIIGSALAAGERIDNRRVPVGKIIVEALCGVLSPIDNRHNRAPFASEQNSLANGANNRKRKMLEAESRGARARPRRPLLDAQRAVLPLRTLEKTKHAYADDPERARAHARDARPGLRALVLPLGVSRWRMGNRLLRMGLQLSTTTNARGFGSGRLERNPR